MRHRWHPVTAPIVAAAASNRRQARKEAQVVLGGGPSGPVCSAVPRHLNTVTSSVSPPSWAPLCTSPSRRHAPPCHDGWPRASKSVWKWMFGQIPSVLRPQGLYLSTDFGWTVSVELVR